MDWHKDKYLAQTWPKRIYCVPARNLCLAILAIPQSRQLGSLTGRRHVSHPVQIALPLPLIYLFQSLKLAIGI